MIVVTRAVKWLVVLAALLCATDASAQPMGGCPEGAPDCFVDTGGSVSSAHRAYRLQHKQAETHHLRAFAEEVTWLTIGTTWYWAARHKNLVDWDRPSAKKRFTLDVIRMDNNTFPINFTLHPWSGSAYYAAARSNGLSFAASSGYALGACIAWEYGIEFREKVSFNDLIFTPLPGISLGEFFSRLMIYVNRPAQAPTTAQKIAGWVFGPLQAFSDALDRKSKVVDVPADALGYSSFVHHSFRFHLGMALQSSGNNDSLLSDLGFDGAFVTIPSYQKRGHFRSFLHDADFSRFWMAFVQGGGDHEFDSYADVSLFGVYEQNIDQDLRGGSIFLGSSLGYRARRSFFPGFRDELAVTHLPGLAIESSLLFGPSALLQLSFRLAPDFAGVRSLSYDRWQAANPEAIGKTALAKQGYVYSFGVSSLLELSLQLRRVTLGGRTWFGAFNSVEGLDRSQETLTVDPRGVDRVLDWVSYLRVAPLPWPGLALELSLMGRRHVSTLASYSTQIDALRTTLRTQVTF